MASISTSVSRERFNCSPHLQQMLLGQQMLFPLHMFKVLFKLPFLFLWFLGLVRPHMSSLRRESQFCMALLDPYISSLLFFLKQIFQRGSSLWGSSQRFGCQIWGTNLYFVLEKHLSGEIPPHYVSLCLVWVFFYKTLSLPLLSRCCPFILCCGEQFRGK